MPALAKVVDELKTAPRSISPSLPLGVMAAALTPWNSLMDIFIVAQSERPNSGRGR